MNDLMDNANKSLTSRTPNLIAAEINNIKEQTKQMVLYNSIEIGRRLVEAKQLLEHGEWGDWLEKSVDYSQRTASNLMRIFDEYGSSQITFLGDNAKSQALANLSYTQAISMLGIPSDEREEFIKNNDIDSMSTRELQKAIKERDEAIKLVNKKAEEVRKTLDEKFKAEAELKTMDEVFKKAQFKADSLEKALRDEKEKSEATRETLDKVITENRKLLEAAQASGNDEEVERLQSSLQDMESKIHESNSQIEELERQLKEKPIDVITAEPQVIEKIPEEITKELQDLRAKANQNNGSDKAAVKFSVQFDSLVKNFKELLGTLEEIQDIEIKEKYKGAAKGLINKMSDTL